MNNGDNMYLSIEGWKGGGGRRDVGEGQIFGWRSRCSDLILRTRLPEFPLRFLMYLHKILLLEVIYWFK